MFQYLLIFFAISFVSAQQSSTADDDCAALLSCIQPLMSDAACVVANAKINQTLNSATTPVNGDCATLEEKGGLREQWGTQLGAIDHIDGYTCAQCILNWVSPQNLVINTCNGLYDSPKIPTAPSSCDVKQAVKSMKTLSQCYKDNRKCERLYFCHLCFEYSQLHEHQKVALWQNGLIRSMCGEPPKKGGHHRGSDASLEGSDSIVPPVSASS